MSDRIQLPAPYQDIAVEVCATSDGGVCIRYWGCKEDLIAAGICTEAMFEKKEIRSKRRLDSDGDQVSVNSYWVRPAGSPVLRYKLWWSRKPRERALRLPGVANAIEVYEAHQREVEEHNERYERSRRGGPMMASEYMREGTAFRESRSQADSTVTRAIGRYQRLVSWCVLEQVIHPDWSSIRELVARRQPSK